MRFGDDLTVIKGIGPARQQWLQHSFGVQTFTDLASLSPDEIELRLKEDGQIARRGAIEEWVGQAKELAATQAKPVLTVPPTAVLGESDWRPFASFVVEIQAQEKEGHKLVRTAVQHIETDANQTWPGIEREKLCHWIMSQVDSEAERFVATQPAPPSEQPTVAITIQQVDIWQQTTALQKLARAERPFAAILHSHEPFSVAAHIAQDAPTDPQDCLAQFHVRDLVSGREWALGETTAVLQTDLTVVAQLTTIQLPRGQFRLTAFVSTPQGDAVKDYFELPFVQVI
ncbi:MAG: hypothetical protein AAF614_43135 [Chloroflexota bacterium]